MPTVGCRGIVHA